MPDSLPGWLGYPAAPGLRDLDLAWGRFLHEQVPHASELALRLAVLCSVRLAQGNPCLDLVGLCEHWSTVLPESWRNEAASVRPKWLPIDGSGCREALNAAAFVGSGAGSEPLVLYGHRLYLARYWRAGVRIRQAVNSRLIKEDTAFDMTAARQWLARVFPTPGGQELDWQKLACANALLQRFAIMTGGPGTGKTRTVVQLLAVLQGLAQQRGQVRGLRIRLAAPTGKAAARLNSSITGALVGLRPEADEVLLAALDRIPTEVVTLHRLLGSRPGTRQHIYQSGHPLDLDVLVVDEASMMDVEMMDAVLAALPSAARLILLGDRDQLASVEAGAMLGELCARAPEGHYLPQHCARLQALCGQSPGLQWQDEHGTALDQAVVMLRHSYRFNEKSGIGRFALAVNAGDVPAVRALRDHPPAGLDVLALQGVGDAASADWLAHAGVLGSGGYGAIFEALNHAVPDPDADPSQWDAWASELLKQQGRFQVLCALRTGPWGVEGLNRLIESRLRAQGAISGHAGPWYAGRPVLVTRNQPELGLANGDIGLALHLPDSRKPGHSVLRVAFEGAAPGAVHWVPPARLPAVETVYALTVHKSQGSEFEHVLLVLPDRPGPLLTRELLYTGATRAQKTLSLVLPGPVSLLDDAVRHLTQRAGGIWNPDS
ncbi:MAG TPA: exodeoxyribonuclease V subunit alpha [Castellaniella sp.]|uniref:exodeoxyribonuclease V subunit alpha n=1 Tax=Castellaniella sp. TaxID=1955812 RepID=UPI002EFE5FE0